MLTFYERGFTDNGKEPAMLGIVDTATVTISVTGIDIIALKKLSLVSHALAQKIGKQSGREQQALANVLDETIRKIEIAAVAR